MPDGSYVLLSYFASIVSLTLCVIQNVLLSRQKSGLVVVGDINVTGDITRPPQGHKYASVSANGELNFVKAVELRNFNELFHANGRVARVRVGTDAKRDPW